MVANACTESKEESLCNCSKTDGGKLKLEFSSEKFKSFLSTCTSPEKARTFSLISCLKPFTIAIESIITATPSAIAKTDIRTINFEKVRLDFRVRRWAK